MVMLEYNELLIANRVSGELPDVVVDHSDHDDDDGES